MRPDMRAGGVGQGPANGLHVLDTSPEAQSERGKKSGFVRRKMRAYREEHPESAVTERAPNRIEIAEIAKQKIPAALEKLESLIHSSRSDMAVVQAFNALKETAFGKDSQTVEVKLEYEHMTESELQAMIAEELGIVTIDHDDAQGSGHAGRIAPPPPAR